MIIIASSFVMLFLQAARTAVEPQRMTTGGWIFMAGAWFCILSLVYFTFSRVLRGARK